MKILITICLFCVFAACASNQITINVKTVPSGAIITSNGNPLGVSPLTVYVPWDNRLTLHGCLKVEEITAIWTSGASASSNGIILFCEGTGLYTYTLTRPTGAPGLDEDMKFALQVEQMIKQNRIDTRRNALLLWNTLSVD